MSTTNSSLSLPTVETTGNNTIGDELEKNYTELSKTTSKLLSFFNKASSKWLDRQNQISIDSAIDKDDAPTKAEEKTNTELENIASTLKDILQDVKKSTKERLVKLNETTKEIKQATIDKETKEKLIKETNLIESGIKESNLKTDHLNTVNSFIVDNVKDMGKKIIDGMPDVVNRFFTTMPKVVSNNASELIPTEFSKGFADNVMGQTTPIFQRLWKTGKTLWETYKNDTSKEDTETENIQEKLSKKNEKVSNDKSVGERVQDVFDGFRNSFDSVLKNQQFPIVNSTNTNVFGNFYGAFESALKNQQPLIVEPLNDTIAASQSTQDTKSSFAKDKMERIQKRAGSTIDNPPEGTEIDPIFVKVSDEHNRFKEKTKEEKDKKNGLFDKIKDLLGNVLGGGGMLGTLGKLLKNPIVVGGALLAGGLAVGGVYAAHEYEKNKTLPDAPETDTNRTSDEDMWDSAVEAGKRASERSKQEKQSPVFTPEKTPQKSPLTEVPPAIQHGTEREQDKNKSESILGASNINVSIPNVAPLFSEESSSTNGVIQMAKESPRASVDVQTSKAEKARAEKKEETQRQQIALNQASTTNVTNNYNTKIDHNVNRVIQMIDPQARTVHGSVC